LLPGAKIWGKVHSASGAPVYALALSVLLATIVMTFGDPDRLINIAMFIVLVFYIIVFVAVLVLRKRYPHANRPYRVPCYPLTPLVAISGSICIAVSMLVNSPWNALYALGITLTGIPVYLIMKK
ncbi:MAG: amino acid permease, partial [Sporomusa sp.]